MKGHEKQREKGKEPKKAGKDLGRFYYLNIKWQIDWADLEKLSLYSKWHVNSTLGEQKALIPL